jgi:hypothetical protein
VFIIVNKFRELIVLRGFGMTIDLETGRPRKWYIDTRGVRRWHDDDTIAVRALPFDVARCSGVGSDEEGWREGCDVCFRRLSPGDEVAQVYIEPPEISESKCKHLISR